MVASRITEPVKTRKSLPLTENDLADIARLRQETPEREALSELAGIVVVESVAEAALLRMVFEAGLRAIREKAEERAYATAAEDRLANGEADEARRIARRRRPTWASED
jgi:ectoine hydroxylase-related dioxygenase (phytanoyl-CoA dioxygenase family)